MYRLQLSYFLMSINFHSLNRPKYCIYLWANVIRLNLFI